MEKKVISIKEAKYAKMYKDFYSNPVNSMISLSVFFKCDVRIANNTKIS
jgi:hypothetical protein